MSITSSVRGYFARTKDAYAGGDLGNARRIGMVSWGLVVGLAILLVPLNPPTDELGAAGWALAGGLILAGVVTLYGMRTGRLDSWGAFLFVSYATAVGIGLLQWLPGGQTPPYRGLLLLPVLFMAATQPPRRIAPFMGVVLVVLAAPFVYDSWDATRAEEIGATFVIWCALAVATSLLMMGVRAQRLSLQAEGEEAREQARVDPLTGLHNRRAFDELLIGEVARARRHEIPLTIAMVDIENFKEVNDRWSYSEGDRCLQEVADALRDSLRQPDFCFRWGGDEFALILSGTPADETEPIAERLRGHVSAMCTRPDSTPMCVRFAAAELGDGMAARDLIKVAGLALTAAKLDDDQTADAKSSTQQSQQSQQ
jgi:diguanylate cyclase (GGDEF)-like protein